ncbi:uncharacterized protein NPIL_447711 [Nephila pilipes]|uniref:Uncharacterized protein n=1 Tax=Nephila pilipes TaxID=299642 RepID=A0A8X6N6T0_NEPPI|nr:uncharacterized protein NPIL_447711 [Nephila pilipes]
MSKDQKSWINPCGFENDMTDNCTQDKSSLDGIDRELEISLNKMKSLRESVKKAYPTVDWESLESLKYSFLELPEFNKNDTWANVYRMLQITAMTIEELQKSKIMSKNDDEEYFEKLTVVRASIQQLLCKVNIILKSNCVTYNDAYETEMLPEFIKGRKMAERHFIAIRQMITVFDKLLKLFAPEKYKSIKVNQLNGHV